MALKVSSAQKSVLSQILSALQSREDLKDRVKHIESFAAKPARFQDWPKGLSPQLIQVLKKSGVEALWSHQAQAIEILHQGKNLAVTTPTASGKTLCFNLPVIQSVLKAPSARALYLYPIKALAQDQLKTLQEWSGRLKAAKLPPVQLGNLRRRYPHGGEKQNKKKPPQYFADQSGYASFGDIGFS